MTFREHIGAYMGLICSLKTARRKMTSFQKLAFFFLTIGAAIGTLAWFTVGGIQLAGRDWLAVGVD